MVLEGLRQSERRLAAIGIAAFPYRLAAFVIAGMGAGLAGALWTNLARFVSPDMLHWTKSGELMIMVSEAENDGELTDRESELIRSAQPNGSPRFIRMITLAANSPSALKLMMLSSSASSAIGTFALE